MSLDDFGDDSFLQDFDPDAAIAEHRRTVHNPYVTKHAFDADPAWSTDGNSFDRSNPLKRQKSAADDETSNEYHHSPNPWNETSLTNTLSKHFGYVSFRSGQYQVINAVLSGRDCAVFWSTGRGKSICYQIPPLHTHKISLIVSPLISLMEDQVSKLNGLLRDESNEKEVAVYLGSAQTDHMAERRALDGEYSIIYCTPEKLVQSSFLEELGQLHLKGKQRNRELCLIAIDEAHCVSEWGHDFRKEYRKVGEMLRSHSVLSQVPIVALTATAVPKVQTDILASLRLRNPLVVQQSFDRENLIISVQKKPIGGYRAALASFVQDMKEMSTQKKRESTIVYCPTRNMVEEISEWLSSQLKSHHIDVQPYHAGLSNNVRSQAHFNFLTGKTLVIVATIAFGMGIDKSDIRRVIHFGPPKTIEDYYQQIGRAGRDGLASHCIMYCNTNDFDAYKSDFYLGNLNATIRANQERSIDALRRYATNDEVCRRAELLHFFNEVPKFGQRCGTCDNCQIRSNNIDDIERNFADNGARLILYALSVLNDRQGTGTLEKILNGNKVDAYRYKNATVVPDDVCQAIKIMRSQLSGYKKRVPVSYFSKDLLPALVNRGFVQVLQQKSVTSGMSNVWSSYTLTGKGMGVLWSGPIMLPVPKSIREYEERQRQKVKNDLAELEKAGADVSQIPSEEIEEGDGIVMKSYRTYYNYIDLLTKGGRHEKIDQLEDLRLRIDAWRMDMASRFRIAPGDAMPDHLLLNVAYTASSMKQHLVPEALVAIGVRSAGIHDLVRAINEWIDEHVDTPSSLHNSCGEAHCSMIIPDQIFLPENAWEHFVYKPVKKTGKAAWESSYERFIAGEPIQAIAMNPSNGRPIQVATVMGHVFDGLLSGRPVNLKALATVVSPPNKIEWEAFTKIEAETGMNVTGDPKVSGKNGASFSMNEFITPLVGEEIMMKDYADRTQEEKDMLTKHYEKLKWYMVLRRIEFTPTFQES